MRKDIRQAVCSRELSWLRFNTRVLEESEDRRVPLMERFMFRNIYSTNLDEFCRTRIGKMLTLSLSDDQLTDTRTGMHPSQQLERIYEHINCELPRADRAFLTLEKELEAYGVKRLTYRDRPVGDEADTLLDVFRREYADTLSPRIITPEDIPPLLENGRVYVVFHLICDEKWAVGLVDCSGLPPMTVISDAGDLTYIMTDELILHFGQQLFPGYSVLDRTSLRITRSAFIDVEPAYADGADTLTLLSEIMDSREKLIAVRTQLSRLVAPIFRYRLLERFNLDDSLINVTQTPLYTDHITALSSRMSTRKELFYEDHSPALPSMLPRGVDLARAAAAQDLLLSYPYESIEPFLQMLKQSAKDPYVTSVKMTLYRLAGESRIIAALCEAARSGKDVFVCMELRARFSECDNIAYSRQLMSAGCRVVFGVPGYKVHSKLCRIDRTENGRTLRITQIGTGNYNENTARHYTDLSFVTSDASIADDADRVFSALEKLELPPETGLLTTSPGNLKARILSLLDMEIAAANAGEQACFAAKLNGLSDPEIIEKLVDASCAGVRIELIVRGICCIKPGIAGLTDNITVRSIVDRFLEHGRIYISGSGARRIVYISSADLMTRNMDRRVEAAVRIKDPALADRLCEYFAAELADDSKSRTMLPDGSYEYSVREGKSSQQLFVESVLPQPDPEPAPEPEPVKEAEPAPEQLPPENPAESDTATAPELSPGDPPAPQKMSLWARIIALFRRKK